MLGPGMGLLRGIGRAAPVLAAGLAAGWYLKRQGLLGGSRQSVPREPYEPRRSPEVAETPQEEPRAEAIDVHVEAVEAVSDAADVTAVVEDLLAVAPGEEEPLVDADSRGNPAEAVRAALAEIPGLASVEVESSGGVVLLRGELERPEAIAEAERRAASTEGVTDVRNLLHLRDTPPPTR
jgi:osmotically-inducible protein OsmY